MENIPIPDHTDMKKLLADLETIDFDDLDEAFRGVTVDDGQWAKYQTVVKALLAAKNRGKGIIKADYLTAPDPLFEYAGAMAVLDKVSSFDGEAKAALILAASMCDRIAITTDGERVRISFTVDQIWKEGENNHVL